MIATLRCLAWFDEVLSFLVWVGQRAKAADNSVPLAGVLLVGTCLRSQIPVMSLFAASYVEVSNKMGTPI